MAPEKVVQHDIADPDNVYHAFRKLLDVTKYFRAYCYESVADLGFSKGEIDVLISLYERPEHNTVKAISENVHLSKGMISQAVESLRRKQFLTVGIDEHDRRMVLVSLTGMAQPVLEKLRAAYTAFMEKIVSGIPPEKLRESLGIITQVYTNKENMKSPPNGETI